MLTTASAAEALIDQKNGSPLVLFLIERMFSFCGYAIILEHILSKPVKSDTLEKTCWNDAISVNVVSWNMKPKTCDFPD
jgi:hypothetical protein